MRIIQFTLALLLATIAMPPHACAADSASVRAILIVASKNKAPADPRLAAYEAPLQRNLPESSFRFVAEGSASVAGAGHATISLDRGHRLELDGEKIGSGGIGLKIEWLNGANTVISGSFKLVPGIPLVLGRRPSGDGDVPIVLVIAK